MNKRNKWLFTQTFYLILVLSDRLYGQTTNYLIYDSTHFENILSSYGENEGYQVIEKQGTLFVFRNIVNRDNGHVVFLCEKYTNQGSETKPAYENTSFRNFSDSIKCEQYKKSLNGRNIESFKIKITRTDSIKDLALLAPFLHKEEIIQITEADTNNILCLVQDTSTFECDLFWFNKANHQIKHYNVSDTNADVPPYKATMMVLKLNDDTWTDFIVNKYYIGGQLGLQCDTEFYKLSLK